MDLYIVAVLLMIYGAVIEAKEALRIGRGNVLPDSELDSEENRSNVLALVIVEDIEDSGETKPSLTYEAPILPWVKNSMEYKNPQIMLPWIEGVKVKDYDEDSSGESNSDEYPDTNTESDTNSESNYYHEDDYIKDKIKNKVNLLDNAKSKLAVLRNRWKSCQKKAAKYCREACRASYKNACEEHSCKKKLKKVLKKECKRNCNEVFIDSS